MQAYIIRRLLLVIPTLLIASVVVFFSVRFIPGDAIDLMVPNYAQFNTGRDDVCAGAFISDKKEETDSTDGEECVDPGDALRSHLGLDQLSHVQYGKWLAGLMQGDLGKSIWTNIPVLEDILIRLPVSIELTLLTILLSLVIALPVGIYSGIRPETNSDYLLRSFAILLITVPSFWVATLVVVLPALWWQWTPPIAYIPFFEDPIEHLKMMLLPAVIMGMLFSGGTMRMTRTMILEVFRQDYVRTAWSKGLRERVVVLRHVLKNTFIPLVTILGLQIPYMIGSAVIIEQIFSLPGIGQLMFNALTRRDYPMVSGINITLACMVLLINLLVDLSYAWLDPRIRFR